MPTVENHVLFCVRDFGEENRELCYMINSWMDAPSRDRGAAHRKTRHDPLHTPFEACKIYGDTYEKGEAAKAFWYIFGLELGSEVERNEKDERTLPCEQLWEQYAIPKTPKNLLIAAMVLQHLRLDGLITPKQVEEWNWDHAYWKITPSPSEIMYMVQERLEREWKLEMRSDLRKAEEWARTMMGSLGPQAAEDELREILGSKAAARAIIKKLKEEAKTEENAQKKVQKSTQRPSIFSYIRAKLAKIRRK